MKLRESSIGRTAFPQFDGLHRNECAMIAETDSNGLQFKDARGVTWMTGVRGTERGKSYRWFLAAGRLERRYELRNGDAKDESIASLRAQLHVSVAVSNTPFCG
jgi:hypothetical protein